MGAHARRTLARPLEQAHYLVPAGQHLVEIVVLGGCVCTYRGDGEVLYTVEARQYEVVTMPFGLGQETVFAKKLTTIEGGIVWNDDNEVSYASPSIRY